MTQVPDIKVSYATIEGSWFVLYAVKTSTGFKCHLETKVDPILTVVLDSAGFARLGRPGSNAGKPHNHCPLRFTPFCYLTISAEQLEEFYNVHDRVSAAFDLHPNKEDQQDAPK